MYPAIYVGGKLGSISYPIKAEESGEVNSLQLMQDMNEFSTVNCI